MIRRFMPGCLLRLGRHHPAVRDWRVCSTVSVDTHFRHIDRTPRVASVVIGDEILNGSVLDTNTQFLAQVMFRNGASLERVETVRDRENDIVNAIHRLQNEVDYIFTSGGIGPTHDDITYESIAKAYNMGVNHHAKTLKLMEEFGVILNEDRMRMALIPERCDILWTPKLWVPLVVVDCQTFILPGVPQMFRKIISENEFRLPCGPQLPSRRLIHTNEKEGDIAAGLRKIQLEYPDVMIGSYPQHRGISSKYEVCVSLLSTDHEQLEKAVRELRCIIKDGVEDDDYQNVASTAASSQL